MWRWDQGRLLYFQFDVLRDIAKVLVRFDNTDISACESLFRKTLMDKTGMPFSPDDYTIKRNYSRVFQCAFLANFIGNKLVVTDMCRELADDNSCIKSVDDFMFNYIPRFRFPFPAFENYNITDRRVYPFCALLKFLLSRIEVGVEAKASLDDIFSYIIANECTGFEGMEHYKKLAPKSYKDTDSERRQLREMMVFISQLSLLKVYNGFIYLDDPGDEAKEEIMKKLALPESRTPKSDRLEEFNEMTSITGKIVIPTFDVIISDPADLSFIEGDRRRVEHFRVERSSRLRKFYRENNPVPHCCACGADMSAHYPWTDYLIEIHHLLPLASAVAISAKGTSLTDIVGLCPSCHKAVHIYYKKWLAANHQSDFASKNEAHDVYIKATKEIA